MIHSYIRHRFNFLLLLLFCGSVYALTPARTIINNQATATYTDSGNTARSVASNTVETVIQQVAGIALTIDQSKPINAGATILYPHVITNNGNGIDTFTLTTADLFGSGGVDFSFTSLDIFADVDANGEPDSNTVITETPDLAPGESYIFVVRALVPNSVATNDQGQLTITGTSQFDGTENVFNTDTAIVTDRAIIEVTKSMSENFGLAGSGPYIVNLIYNNPSDKIATDVVIVDVLPTFMLYASTANWSIGSLSLSDANEDAQGITPSITYCAYDSSCLNAPFLSSQVTFVIDEVGAGQSGTVSFEVTIDSAAIPGTIFNNASFQYNDSVSVTPLVDSNKVPFVILPTALVDIVGDTAPDAQPGQTVFFTNVVTNNGNAQDVFNIVLDADGSSSFPAGTFFTLLQSDGATPLTDTNGDGIADTGPLDPAEKINVIVSAMIPPNASAGTFSINKTASSLNDGNVVDTDADSVTVVIPTQTVDLTNNLPAGDVNCDALADTCGFGLGPEASAQTTIMIAPGEVGVFVLYATNLLLVPDTYDLSASTDPTFASQALPLGWNVAFVNDAGVPITNTGSINSTQAIRVRALVSVPADFVSGNESIYFRVRSPITGATDIKHDEVEVGVVEGLKLTPNSVGQTAPNSFINYTHELINNGNDSEVNIALATADSQTANGWVSIIYEDTNGSGIFDSGDLIISNVPSLAAGATKKLFVRVFAPSNAPLGVSNQTILTATYNSGADTLEVNDVTTINPFNVDVVKEQAVDDDCNGVPESAYSVNPFNINPGQCVIYRIITQNNSADKVFNVQIIDATPTYTQYAAVQPAIRCVPAVCTFTNEPVAGGIGTIQATAGTLNAGTQVELFFSVELEAL